MNNNNNDDGMDAEEVFGDWHRQDPASASEAMKLMEAATFFETELWQMVDRGTLDTNAPDALIARLVGAFLGRAGVDEEKASADPIMCAMVARAIPAAMACSAALSIALLRVALCDNFKGKKPRLPNERQDAAHAGATCLIQLAATAMAKVRSQTDDQIANAIMAGIARDKAPAKPDTSVLDAIKTIEELLAAMDKKAGGHHG